MSRSPLPRLEHCAPRPPPPDGASLQVPRRRLLRGSWRWASHRPPRPSRLCGARSAAVPRTGRSLRGWKARTEPHDWGLLTRGPLRTEAPGPGGKRPFFPANRARGPAGAAEQGGRAAAPGPTAPPRGGSRCGGLAPSGLRFAYPSCTTKSVPTRDCPRGTSRCRRAPRP